MGKLGMSIREHRKEKGLKVYQLANKVEVSPEFITAVERGYKYPSVKVLMKICKVLGFNFGLIYLKEKHPDIIALLKGKREVKPQLWTVQTRRR